MLFLRPHKKVKVPIVEVVLRFNGPLRHYFSLYRDASWREMDTSKR